MGVGSASAILADDRGNIMTDAQLVDQVVAGDLLDTAIRALQLPMTAATLRTARENVQEALAAIGRLENAFAVAAARGGAP